MVEHYMSSRHSNIELAGDSTWPIKLRQKEAFLDLAMGIDNGQFEIDSVF
jgi:hypothetical protein